MRELACAESLHCLCFSRVFVKKAQQGRQQVLLVSETEIRKMFGLRQNDVLSQHFETAWMFEDCCTVHSVRACYRVMQTESSWPSGSVS